MIRHLRVQLHGRDIGDLVDDGGAVRFRFRPEYWRMRDRPVLGRWFEDGDPDEVYSGRRGDLPPFFQNLEPEGVLARELRERFGLGGERLALLGVTGPDLAGAMQLVPERPVRRRAIAVVQQLDAPKSGAFSIAGVQMKLSVQVAQGERVTLPAPGELGDCILKVPPRKRMRHASENEHATMQWAGRAGFDVAHTWVLDADHVTGVYRKAQRPVLVVERFDRGPQGAIHQEDLAQALWLYAAHKYPEDRTQDGLEPHGWDDASRRRRAFGTEHATLARWVRALLGEAGALEFLRRVVLTIATGNGDAHLKNWSLLYTHRQRPVWSPLYDQVSTIAWQDNTLALALFGDRSFRHIHLDTLVRLGGAAGLDAQRSEHLVSETLRSLKGSWQQGLHYPADHARRLVGHWRRVPVLRDHGPL